MDDANNAKNTTLEVENNNSSDAVNGKTDGRKPNDWKSGYSDKTAKIKQFIEAAYLFIIVVISFVILYNNYIGKIAVILNIPPEQSQVFTKMIYCSVCGLLGGAIFDIKWFYKTIAHGYWNEDRVYWRFFTPIVSLTFAFCLACIFGENIIVHDNGFAAATLGFLSGYFSDEAVGKMAEVAKVLFNTNKESK